MTMRITMTQAAMGESGSVLAAGSTYTVSVGFGREMVLTRKWATDTDNVIPERQRLEYQEEKSAAAQALVSGDGSPVYPSSEYHCHCYAPLATDSDRTFRDISGALADGAFQTNLAAAAAWATAGFLTQANPASAGQLTMVEFPALSWDWAAGDSLFVHWAGRLTPEGSDMVFLGDTTGASFGNGIRLLSSSTGKLKANAYQQTGSLSRFSGTGTSTVFEASVTHSMAVCFSPAGIAFWSDGARDATYASGFIMPSSGGLVSTVNTATLKLGGDGGTASSIQNGPAMQTRALAILKGRRDAPPAIADLDALAAALHRNPAGLVSAAAW
jgi:hypothetical protein